MIKKDFQNIERNEKHKESNDQFRKTDHEDEFVHPRQYSELVHRVYPARNAILGCLEAMQKLAKGCKSQ